MTYYVVPVANPTKWSSVLFYSLPGLLYLAGGGTLAYGVATPLFESNVAGIVAAVFGGLATIALLNFLLNIKLVLWVHTILLALVYAIVIGALAEHFLGDPQWLFGGAAIGLLFSGSSAYKFITDDDRLNS